MAGIYAEAGTLLRDGGLLVNADHMVDPELPRLNAALAPYESEQAARRQAVDGAEELERLVGRAPGDARARRRGRRRDRRFAERDAHHTELDEPAPWHVDALRAAGFAEAGLLWRSLTDAAVIGLR